MALANDWLNCYYFQNPYSYCPNELSVKSELIGVASTLVGNDSWKAQYCNTPNTLNLGEQSVQDFFNHFMNPNGITLVVEHDPPFSPPCPLERDQSTS